MDERPLLVGVGGFLGAGKTTAIVAAVERLRGAGRRVAVVTNDQASGLVDTAVVRAALSTETGSVAEIAGGCFCCRYDDLVGALEEVIGRVRPEVILAEAVGSCTDLAATVYQPLRQLGRGPVRLGPLTVVADGTRLRSLARLGGLPRLSSDVNYLFGQQLAEADVLLLNKVDQMSGEEVARVRRYLEREYPGVPVVAVSALSGEGMDGWIAGLEERGDAGGRVLELDYDRYAEAEAEMGWLNLAGRVAFDPEDGAAVSVWVRAVLGGVSRRAGEAGAEVAHMKVLVEAGGGACRGHLTGTENAPFVVVNGRVAGEASVTLNARVATEPERLRGWVAGAMGEADATVGGRTAVNEVACFAPSRPVPTHRLRPAAMPVATV